MNRTAARFAIFPAAALLLTAVTGCPDDLPNANRVLEGTWRLDSAANEPDQEIFLTFDRDGNLEEVEVIFDDGRLRTRSVNATSDVIGDSVRITSRFLIAGRLIFEGEFDADFNVITGDTTTQLTFPGTIVEIDGAPATLTRVD